MSNIVIGMKKKEKSKDSLDESLDSLESGDRTDDSLEIFDDSLGMSQLKIGHNESLTCVFEICKMQITIEVDITLQKISVMKLRKTT